MASDKASCPHFFQAAFIKNDEFSDLDDQKEPIFRTGWHYGWEKFCAVLPLRWLAVV
jgi:hypothetical protein